MTVRNEHARLSPPLGLAYLASALRACGHGVSAVDFNVSGLNLHRLDGIIAYDRPAVVGISAMTETYVNGLAIARRVKETAPDTIVVFGGPHATIVPADVAAEDAVDYVIAGAGEAGLPMLVDRALGRPVSLCDIPGLVWSDELGSHENPRATIAAPDALPRPSRDLFPTEFYHDKWNVLTATGSCPYRCPFCSASALWKGRRVMRDPADIAAEVAELVQQEGADRIFFTDDLFTLNKRWLRDLLGRLDSIEGRPSWGCATRVDQVDAALLHDMARAGCTGIQFGVESGAQEVLDSVKGISKDQVLEAVRAGVAEGIDIVSSFMIPFPEDTPETLAESLDFMKQVHEAGSRIFLSYTCPFPGTSFHDRAVELGVRILSDRWDQYDAKHVVMETRHLSAAQIEATAERFARELGLQRSVVA